jgi:hypothetical protein
MKRITIITLFCLTTSLLSNGQLIINHLNTDITTLTEAKINLAKQTLHIVYGHTSHGSQLIDGMNGLIGFANGGGKGLSFPDDIFNFNYDGWDGALDLRDGDGLPEDVGYYPQWYNASRSYLENAGNASRNVMMWSWCGQVSWYSEQNIIDWYLTPMTQLENDFPNVKFVYFTGHLDGTGTTGNLNLRNQQIRDYCIVNKKILYDFADIESYDPDGNYYGDKHPTDGCTYDFSNNGSTSETGDPDLPVEGSGDRNWAIDWQNTHTQNVDWYSCGAAHTQPLNANQKAFAAWHMFAEIARIIALESIPSDISVSDTIVGNGETACFDATDTLTFTGETDTVEFQNGSVVDLIAGNTIRLLPGFHAQEGSSVYASITTTSQYCFSSASSPMPVEKSTKNNASITATKTMDIGFDFNVYPNPGREKVTISFSDNTNNTTLMITNSFGKIVDKQIIRSRNQFDIETSSYPKGIYFFTIQNEYTVKTQKIIIL